MECAKHCGKSSYKYFIFGIPYKGCVFTKASNYKTNVCKCYCEGPLANDKCGKIYHRKMDVYKITVK